VNAVAPYLKAVTGALVAGLGVLASGLDDGGLSAQEWIYAAVSFLVGLGAVYTVPNKTTG
jgi:hypothetical protein